jgi:hypothetical protein
MRRRLEDRGDMVGSSISSSGEGDAAPPLPGDWGLPSPLPVEEVEEGGGEAEPEPEPAVVLAVPASRAKGRTSEGRP